MPAQIVQLLSSSVAWLGGFISAHITILSLLGLAFVATMREELPKPFSSWPICAWWYGWLHDALKAFINMRSPAPAQPQPTIVRRPVLDPGKIVLPPTEEKPNV